MKDLEKIVEKLRQERDELRLQMHLASAELKDEWSDAERKLSRLELRLEKVGRETKAAAGEVGEAAEELGEQIGKAFKRIRKSLR